MSRFESDNCNFYLKNYTALMVEFMGNTDKTDLSGYEGAEYFVDAVIDCDASFDERPHQIKSKTDFGYIVYIPDSVMDTLEHKPARGDLVDASFRYAACADGTLTFYDNPASAIAAAKPADVNATVKLYNYDSTMDERIC